MPVNFQLIDLSPYADDITGYVSFLETSVGPLHPPTRIRNKWHYNAVFGYGLSKCIIYTKGYLDKVMVSGINDDGQRVHIFLQKEYKRGKYARRHKPKVAPFEIPDFVVVREDTPWDSQNENSET